MRIKHSCVLTIVLVGSAPLWGQTPEEGITFTAAAGTTMNADPIGANPAKPDVPAPATIISGANTYRGGTTVSEGTLNGSSAANLGVPGPLDYPVAGEGDLPLPPNCAPQSYWFRADYVMWFMRADKTPPYIDVLAVDPSNTSGYKAATVFPHNDQVGYNPISGLRIDTGFWFDSPQHIGIDLSGFGTGSVSKGTIISSNASGVPIIGRLYNDANLGTPDAVFFSNSDPAHTYAGTVGASSTINQIYNGDISLRWNGYRIYSDNTDYLFGVRYFHFDEQVNIFGNSTLPDGTQRAVVDNIKVENNFYGGQVGVDARLCAMYGFSFDGSFKFAMGSMNEKVEINGANSLTPPGGVTSVQPVGLYAQPSNSGDHTRDKFAVIPEFTFNLNYNITQHAAVYIGWNFLYVSEVARAAAAIDPTINNSNLRYIANPTPGNAPGPIFNFKNQDFWMQGIDIGLRLEF